MPDSADEKLEHALRLQEQTDELMQAGRYAEAEARCRECIACFEETDGPDCPDVANLLFTLGSILDILTRYAEAVECARRATGIMDKIGHLVEGPEGRLIEIQAVQLLGHTLRQQGKYAEAEPHLRRAIALAESYPDREVLANALNAFGMYCKYSGRFEEGAAAYQRGLEISRECRGEMHASTATLYHNIGGLEHARERFDAAEAPARRAWEIRRELLGEDHIDTLADACAYAGVLDGLGRHVESRAIYQHALQVYESVLGPEHYEVAATLHNLAYVESAEGHPREAIANYRRSLQIKDRVMGDSHPDWALTANNLAMVLLAEGESAEAAGLLRRAVAVFESNLEPGHPHIEMGRANLAEAAAVGKTE